MGSYRPWESGFHDKSYCLTIRLLLGGKGLTFSLPPVLLVLLLLCGLASYKLANTQALSERQRQAARIAVLEEKNQELENFLADKEKEREHLVSLAESRSEELWAELENRDRELSRLWRIVGESPGQTNYREKSTRQSLLGSRYGRLAERSALAVKVGYSQLDARFQKSGQEMTRLAEAAKEYRRRKVEAYRLELADRTPSIRPCSGEMSSGFGNRLHPVYGYGRFHGGCDFTAPHGTPLQATAAGTVVHSDWLGGYGKVVEIDHGNGLKTLYAHCSELMVKKGETVAKGQKIATVGSTGLSSGPHCHYEVRLGDKQIDPSPYLKDASQKDASKPLANSQ